MRGDYEEMEPVEDAGGFPAVAVAVVLTLAFVWLLALGAGCAAGAEPPQVMLEPPQVMLARAEVKTPEATPPSRVVIVPGRWEYGADGLWRFYPESPTPLRGPVGTAADGRYAPEVAAPARPFQPDPLSTPTTNATAVARPSTSFPAAGRVRLTHTLAGGAGTFGSTNCTSFG